MDNAVLPSMEVVDNEVLQVNRWMRILKLPDDCKASCMNFFTDIIQQPISVDIMEQKLKNLSVPDCLRNRHVKKHKYDIDKNKFIGLCIAVCVRFNPFQEITLDQFPELEDIKKNHSDKFKDNYDNDALIAFGAAMKICGGLVNPSSRKGALLFACALLEGRGKLYAPGGKPSKETQRRMKIYEELFKHPNKRKQSSSSASSNTEEKHPSSNSRKRKVTEVEDSYQSVQGIYESSDASLDANILSMFLEEDPGALNATVN